jgi:hypothetical protein
VVKSRKLRIESAWYILRPLTLSPIRKGATMTFAWRVDRLASTPRRSVACLLLATAICVPSSAQEPAAAPNAAAATNAAPLPAAGTATIVVYDADKYDRKWDAVQIFVNDDLFGALPGASYVSKTVPAGSAVVTPTYRAALLLGPPSAAANAMAQM